jgi:hypothetical protein
MGCGCKVVAIVGRGSIRFEAWIVLTDTESSLRRFEHYTQFRIGDGWNLLQTLAFLIFTLPPIFEHALTIPPG